MLTLAKWVAASLDAEVEVHVQVFCKVTRRDVAKEALTSSDIEDSSKTGTHNMSDENMSGEGRSGRIAPSPGVYKSAPEEETEGLPRQPTAPNDPSSAVRSKNPEDVTVPGSPLPNSRLPMSKQGHGCPHAPRC